MPIQCLVILSLMVMLARCQRGPGGVGASVLGLVVVGEDGDFIDTPGSKVWDFLRR